MMGAAILMDLVMENMIPVCTVVGILFSLVQWFLVSHVKLTPERQASSNNSKNGYTEYVVKEEEDINDQNVVLKCAEIQSAISEDQMHHEPIIFMTTKSTPTICSMCKPEGLLQPRKLVNPRRAGEFEKERKTGFCIPLK